MRAATQRDVAKSAGVSLSTVSLVFSNNARISDSTKLRVRAWATKMGYVPNPRLSAFARSRWQTGVKKPTARIAVLKTTDPSQRDFAERYMEPESSGLRRIAAEHGYGIEWVDLKLHHATSLAEKLKFLDADGIFVPMVPQLPTWVADVIRDYPCVGLFCNTRDVQMPMVDADAFNAAVALYETMIARGYRRIGLIMYDVPLSQSELARAGGALAARERIYSTTAQLPILAWNPDDGKALKTYIHRHRPDSLLVYDARWLPIVESLGFRVPQDIALAAIMAFKDYPASGMYINESRLIQRVIELLDTMVRGQIPSGEMSQVRELVPCVWSEGRTLPRRPIKKNQRD